jgi:hypothetical protein
LAKSEWDEAHDRADRMSQTLEELRLNTEDLHELAKQAQARALRTMDNVRAQHRILQRQSVHFKKT